MGARSLVVSGAVPEAWESPSMNSGTLLGLGKLSEEQQVELRAPLGGWNKPGRSNVFHIFLIWQDVGIQARCFQILSLNFSGEGYLKDLKPESSRLTECGLERM